MRKMIFSMATKSKHACGLEITTHRGRSVLVRPDVPSVIELEENETMTDAQIVAWYVYRFGAMGLKCQVVNDEKEFINDKPISEVAQTTDSSKVESIKTDDATATAKATVEKKTTLEKPLSEFSYSELIAFAKEHNITVLSRAKADYLKAIEEFLA